MVFSAQQHGESKPMYFTFRRLLDNAGGDTKGEGLQGNQPSGFMVGLYGVLYTLAKEKFSDSAKIAIANVVIDFTLIVVIFLNQEYPWVVNRDLWWV